MTQDPANNLVLARSAADLVQAHNDGKSALVLSFQNARILGTDPKAIDEFYAAGVRVFALTHMGHNDFADSSSPVFNSETGSHEVAEEHGSLDDMLNHIDYVVQRIGIDHVGIGTDFNHGSGIVGYDDASEALNVTKALLARGYSQANVEKIWGSNFVRVFGEAATKADPTLLD